MTLINTKQMPPDTTHPNVIMTFVRQDKACFSCSVVRRPLHRLQHVGLVHRAAQRKR